jgi:hypothetical protein
MSNKRIAVCGRHAEADLAEAVAYLSSEEGRAAQHPGPYRDLAAWDLSDLIAPGAEPPPATIDLKALEAQRLNLEECNASHQRYLQRLPSLCETQTDEDGETWLVVRAYEGHPGYEIPKESK